MHKFDQSIWDNKKSVKQELKNTKPSGKDLRGLAVRVRKIEQMLNIAAPEAKE